MTKGNMTLGEFAKNILDMKLYPWQEQIMKDFRESSMIKDWRYIERVSRPLHLQEFKTRPIHVDYAMRGADKTVVTYGAKDIGSNVIIDESIIFHNGRAHHKAYDFANWRLEKHYETTHLQSTNKIQTPQEARRRSLYRNQSIRTEEIIRKHAEYISRTWLAAFEASLLRHVQRTRIRNPIFF